MAGLIKQVDELTEEVDKEVLRGRERERLVRELEADLGEAREVAHRVAAQSLDAMVSEFAEMKEEFEHKFQMQLAEVKRLDMNLANISKKTRATGMDVQAMDHRVGRLERMLSGESSGDDDDPPPADDS